MSLVLRVGHLLGVSSPRSGFRILHHRKASLPFSSSAANDILIFRAENRTAQPDFCLSSKRNPTRPSSLAPLGVLGLRCRETGALCVGDAFFLEPGTYDEVTAAGPAPSPTPCASPGDSKGIDWDLYSRLFNYFNMGCWALFLLILFVVEGNHMEAFAFITNQQGRLWAGAVNQKLAKLAAGIGTSRS
eukprot:RCo047942